MNIRDILKPSTIDEAKELKSNLNNSKYLAGGTDLVLNLRKDEISAEYLIDLRNINSLKKITQDEKYIAIGSMITFSMMKDSEIIKGRLKSLFECSSTMGSPQIRNMATIGGNIVNAGPAADGIPCIMALDGILVFESTNKIRKISCREYFEFYDINKAEDDELLTKILIPKKDMFSGFYKLGKRNSLSIARLSTAISLSVKEDKITSLSISLGAVSKYPLRISRLENEAVGKGIQWLFSEEPLTILEDEVYRSISGRKTMPFKKEAIKGVYKNALNNALYRRE